MEKYIDVLKSINYNSECAHGFDEAKEVVTRYLALNKPLA